MNRNGAEIFEVERPTFYWKLPGTALMGDGGSDSKAFSFSPCGTASWEGLGWSLLVMRSRLAPSTDDREDVESPCLSEGVESGLGFSACDGPVAVSCDASTDASEATEAVDTLLRKGFRAGSCGGMGFAT